MDITVELHCDKCGSANLSLPPREDESSTATCNDCGEANGTLAELREELFACALQQGAEAKREELDRLA
jgi:uncharacterized Zn finger protein